ncbi:hypothetical protein ACKAV7_011586 [Fusarium commune]
MTSPLPRSFPEEDPWDALEKRLDRLLDTKDPDSEHVVKVQAVPRPTEKKTQGFAPWKDERTYFRDPLFVGVGPVVEEPEFVELKIQDKVSMVDFFPEFKNGAFQDLALENFLLQWYDKKIGQEEPGLYLRVEIRLGGILNSVLEIFESFIYESDILIRLSAHLGFTLDATDGFRFKQLTFAGALEGVVVCYPIGIPVLTIYSAGVRVVFKNLNPNVADSQPKPGPQASSGSNPDKRWTEEMAQSTALLDKGTGSLDNPAGPITKQANAKPAAVKDTPQSAFRVEVFGDVKLSLPGDILPLSLQYTASIAGDSIHLDMVLRRGEVWISPLGVEGVTLVDLLITADISTTKTDKGKRQIAKGGDLDEGFACKFSGSWAYHTRRIILRGELYSAAQTQNVSFIEGTMENVTFDDIKKLAKAVHKHEIQQPERKMEFDTMTLRIEAGKLSVIGAMKLDGGWAKVSIWVSKEGLRVTGSMSEWPLDNGIVVKEVKLDFVIGKRKKGDVSDPFGGSARLEDGKELEGEDGKLKKSDGDKAKDTKDSDDKSTQPPKPRASADPGFDASAKAEAKANEARAAVPAKEAARNTSESPVAKKEPPPGEVTWFIGMRVYGDVVVPIGEKESSAPDAEYKLRIRVTASFTYTDKGKWELLVAGKARTTVSLRDFFPDAIKKGGFFDAQLSDLTIFGTNMAEAYLPPEIFRHKITKGQLFLYFCHLRSKIDPGSQPILKFFGELYMRMEEGREEPLKLTLELGVDAVTGSLGLLMEKSDGIRNPLGLGNSVKLYRLGGSISLKWPAFLSSGTIDTFGITASIGINEDRYDATLVMGPNPANTLIKFVAPRLDMGQIAGFIISALDKEFEAPKGNIISFHGVDIYSSAGITYFGVFYPMGIRFKGEVRIFEWSAAMDAELSTMGFIFKSEMKNFRLGPLVVRGAKPEDPGAVLDVELTLVRQKFRLSGMIQIFDSWVLADIHCQLMPKRIFYFNFELFWSDGLYIKVKAEMISTKTADDPKAADWRLEATIEQTIVAQVKKAITKTIDVTHEAMKRGIGAAIKAMDDAEAEYKRQCEVAQVAMDKLIKENDFKVQELQRSIAEAIANLERVKSDNARQRSAADVNYNSKISNAEKERALKLEPYNSKHQNASRNLNQVNSEQPWRVEEARRKRDEAREQFMRVFGDAERKLQSAIDDVARANRVVDILKGEVASYEARCSSQWWRADLHAVRGILKGELAVARLALLGIEALLRGARDTLQSDAFRTLKQAMYSAAEALTSIIDGFKSRIASLQYMVDETFEELQAAVQDGNLQFDRLKQAAQNIRAMINEELARQERESQARSDKLSLELKETGVFLQSTAYLTAKKSLDFAQNNNFALIAAKKALEGFQKVDEAAYQAVRGFVNDAIDSLVDVQLIHFKGEIKANKNDQKPFTLIIGGTMGRDRRFLFALQWMPGQTAELLVELGKRAVMVITGTYSASSLEEALKLEFKDYKPAVAK